MTREDWQMWHGRRATLFVLLLIMMSCCGCAQRSPGEFIVVHFLYYEGFADKRPEFKANPLLSFSPVRNIYVVGDGTEGDFELLPGKKMSVDGTSIKLLQTDSNYTLRCDGGKLGYLYVPRSIFSEWNGVARAVIVHLNANGEITAEWEHVSP